jgi:hypothetical protein
MKIKAINIEKTQNDHHHRVLSTTLADTNNIASRSSLAVPSVGKVHRQVRNSPFQCLSLFLRIISI